jgi:opacity protein-like surface antigen
LPFRRSAGGTTTFAEFDRQTHFGYAVGEGAEAKVVLHFSAKIEYLYVDLAEQDYAFLNIPSAFGTNADQLSGHYRDSRAAAFFTASVALIATRSSS